MRFKGQLLIPTEPGPGLSVDLEVADRHLAVVSATERLGSWPLNAVKVRRLAGDRFEMRVAGEDLHFVADDTISFAYDGIQAIEGSGGEGTRSRSPFRALRSLFGIAADTPAMPLEVREDSAATTSDITEPASDNHAMEWPEWIEPAGEDPPIEDEDSTSRVSSGNLSSIAEFDIDEIDIDEIARKDEKPEWALEPFATSPRPTAEDVSERSDHRVEDGNQECRALRNDGRPCRSPIVGPAGYCYPHDPANPVGKVFHDAQEARARLRQKRAARLGRVYARLDRALKDLERGDMDTEKAMAMAQLARTMCAILELGDGEDPQDGEEATQSD